MSEHLPIDPSEDSSEPEEVVFEELERERPATPRTAAAGAPFFTGQILAGRFEVLGDLGSTDTVSRIQAKDRVRGGAELVLEIVHRAVTVAIEDLPGRIQAVVPCLKELSHDAIDPLLDFGLLPDGRIYFASQYLHGRSLADLLAANEPLEPEDAFAITRQVLSALEYGLGLGQSHGGLDATRILLEDGAGSLPESVRLLSFGNATVLAPANGPSPSGRDLQTVGPLLAQMLVGRPVTGHLHTWWENNAPALPRSAQNVVTKALQSTGGNGFAGVREFREAIDGLRLGGVVEESGGLKRLLWMAAAAGGLGAAAIWFIEADRARVLAGDGEGEVAEGDAEAGASSEMLAGVDELPSPAGEGDGSAEDPDAPLESVPGLARDAAEAELLRRIDQQIARLRDGVDLTNETVVDLRAATQALDGRMDSLDSRIGALEESTGSAPVTVDAAPAPTGLPLPDEAPPELVTVAEELFGGKDSPFGPLGSRSVHHTRTSDGDEGWLVLTVDRDDVVPTGADRSWILVEEYLSASGRPLGSRRVRVVQRGPRFEEVDGRVYGLLDLENPWIELHAETFEPRADLTPPSSLGIAPESLRAFRERLADAPAIALIEVDEERKSWFVPGLGFVRYEDPRRIRRELVLLESR